MRSAIRGSWVSQIRQHRSRFGVAVLAILIAWAALFVDGFPPPSWKAWLGIKDHAPVPAAMRPQRRIPGQMTVTMPRPRGTDSSVSPVPLPLILVSTQIGRNSREGIARIGVDPTSPQTYTAGAILANGARLAEVYPNYVVLERGDRSVRLYVQGQGAAPTEADLGPLLTVGGAAPPPLALAEAGPALTDFVRPSPVFNGSAVQGFQVYAGKDASTFEALGLRDGDVIVALNGASVSNAETALALLNTLVHGSALTAEVKRGGSTETLSLDGSIIVAAAERHHAEAMLAHGHSTTT